MRPLGGKSHAYYEWDPDRFDARKPSDVVTRMPKRRVLSGNPPTVKMKARLPEKVMSARLPAKEKMCGARGPCSDRTSSRLAEASVAAGWSSRMNFALGGKTKFVRLCGPVAESLAPTFVSLCRLTSNGS